ncbi:serine hydrolase domain-containing protein [Streptomyces sp. NPDC004629]|uniref:serine hydrolase domain-containing protein n=1 Tax=Streptomyces sp. NPDC004629 TaxID=3364705 RepID=UPI003692F021
MSGPILPGGALDPALLTYAREEMRTDDVPGLALGVLHAGRTATTGIGVTSVPHPRPVDGETLFQIGSISKTFTVTALLQLVERGALDLDDPVRAHLPAFAVADDTASAQATVRECMTHSCGWEGDFFDFSGRGDDALASTVRNMAALRQVTPRGRMWSYNNAAFYPLGRIIETLHGTTYENAVARELFGPLGMTSACFFAEDVLHRSFAVGHTRHEGRTVLARPWAMPRSANPVGGVVAGAEDLMRYAQFQLYGGQILGDPLRLAAQRAAGPAEDTPEIGLGWWIDGDGPDRIVHHGGGANGQPALFAMMPARELAVAVLTNGTGGAVTARRIVDWIARTYFGVREKPPEAEAVPEIDTDAWTGTYETRLDRYVLRREGDGLVLDSSVLGEWLENADPPTVQGVRTSPVQPLTDRTLLISPGQRRQTTATLLTDARGDIRWLRFAHRAALR